MLDFNDARPQLFPVDDNSVRQSESDCVLFLRPVPKGHCLCDCVEGVKQAAPLIYDLEIPIEIVFPADIQNEIEFAVKTLTTLSPEFNRFVIGKHEMARQDDADFYMSLIEVFGPECPGGWRAVPRVRECLEAGGGQGGRPWVGRLGRRARFGLGPLPRRPGRRVAP